ncbi:LEAF RUST 10 DISEASE-RESISTANCE LOCUS RECEPTOR-LIKE PROTEIN KINASE-like 2.5 [Lotus japonicus]|uniref:LEAF RUST 10 DISEASE-RESISTANCE LOCUS RECEPTOR-LIKE PROTEIN KINASE-like 2.5 n=1 Tax=Lotus japonicus TaxID=34305 RepID=UPI00258EB8C1|nr:LEAF RUST 10 DISEASE-RESISTANCE LOCUS RECEPTOR-LIKE PROTEIN KINASE-like 2.5 [Lotus japonicus]
MTSLFIWEFSLIFSQFLLLGSAEHEEEKCPPSFDCGYLGQISFPFTTAQYPHCGTVAIHGCHDKNPFSNKTIQVNNHTPSRQFFVTNVDHTTITVSDYDQHERLHNKDCRTFDKNFTLPPASPLASYYLKYNITMFRCNPSLRVQNLPKFFHNYTKCSHSNIYYGLPNTEKPRGGFELPTTMARCSAVQVAVKGQPDGDDPFEFLSSDMVIEVEVSHDCRKCINYQKGYCQLDTEGKFYCAQDKSRKKMLIVATDSSVVCGCFLPPTGMCQQQVSTYNQVRLSGKHQHPDCGILAIHGCDDHDPTATKIIKNNDKWFNIAKLEDTVITVRDSELILTLSLRSCGIFDYKSIFNVSTPLATSQLENSVFFFKCNDSIDLRRYHSVSTKSAICNYTHPDIDESVVVAVSDSDNTESRHLKGCSKMVQLPMSDEVGHKLEPGDLFNFVSADFAVQIQVSRDCSACRHRHGGRCRLDNTGKFYCDQGKSTKTKLIVIAVASVVGALLVLIFLAWSFRRRYLSKQNPAHQIIEMFLKNHGRLTAIRYSYAEIKKATNSFKNKLGKGGYGSVYKGKLHDGSLVAVKVLSDSKGNGEEFINEVASISVTSHVNIVTLLGFCLEGSKRALIYEYMPNGSLEKFIYESKDPTKLNLLLSCKAIYNIAIGVARGLEYLHRGCNSRILHFDIKPHNILLDEDFCPKISDFGLAKVCETKESIISLLGTRGTAGYIAPELFSRNFGGVSHKSDVYSYGMMVLEMVGGKQNINVEEAQCSSEIYFPQWIYKRLELKQDPGLRCIRNENDKEMIRKVIIVSLWCIQTDPSHRPAMSEVVDMLESSLQSLQIPPKPYLSSPPRSPPRSSDFNTQTSQAFSTFDGIDRMQQFSELNKI